MTLKIGYTGSASRNDLDARFNERGRTPQDYGWTASLSVAASTLALQDWLDAVAESGRGVLPNGTYAHDGTLTITGDNVVIQFEDDAWLAPTAGWALKASTLTRSTIRHPRVLLTGSTTATRGLWINQSTRITLDEPIVWAEVIPDGFIGVDVDDNSYWSTITVPHVRKDSAAVVGLIPVGIRFRNESNAGRIIGGDFAHCEDAVQVDGCNAIRVVCTDFEDVTTGIALLEPTILGKNGAFVSFGSRFESVTYSLDIRYTYAETQPIQHYGHGYETASQINNPNNQPIGIVAPGGVRIRESGQAISFAVTEAVRLKELAGSATLEANGNVILAADKDANGSGAVVLTVGGVTVASVSTTALNLYKRLGTANAVAATTPGTVVKKLEVFDTSGTSLGFIPIYSSIT